MAWLGPRSHIALARAARKFRDAAHLARVSPAELRLWCEPWTHAALRDAASSLRRWRPQRLVLRGTRDDHAFRLLTDVSPIPHDAVVEALAIHHCAGLGDIDSKGEWAGARRLSSLDMSACTVPWSAELVDAISRLTALRVLRVHNDDDDDDDDDDAKTAVADVLSDGTETTGGFARALRLLAPTLIEFEATFSASQLTLAVLRDSPGLRSLRIGRALWAENGTKLRKKAVADAAWTQAASMCSLTSLHLPLRLDVHIALPRLLTALPALHDLGAHLVGTREVGDYEAAAETDPDYEPPTSRRCGSDDDDGDGSSDDNDDGKGNANTGAGNDDDDDDDKGNANTGAGNDDDDADHGEDVDNGENSSGRYPSGECGNDGRASRPTARENAPDVDAIGLAIGTPSRRSATSRVWWYANSLRVRRRRRRRRRRMPVRKGGGGAVGSGSDSSDDNVGETDEDDVRTERRPTTLLRTLRSAHDATRTHLPDVLALSELHNLTLAAQPHAYRTRAISRWPALLDAQHLGTLTLERVTWCNERRFALSEPKGGLFFVLDHAWLPALRTLVLVDARLVPANIARLVGLGSTGGGGDHDDDDDDDGDGDDDGAARRPATDRETEAARSPLYVARPHTSLGVLARICNLTLTNSEVCVAVLPRFDGVTRLEFAGETRADMGELARRFPALRDLTVGETALRRDAQSLIRDALPPTPRIGDTPVWVTALAETIPGLRTLAIHESDWPRDPVQLTQCCVTRDSRIDRRAAWRPWIDVVAAALSDDQSFEWHWHASEWVTTAAPWTHATCCHDAPSWAASPTLPCAQAADCILAWYRTHAPVRDPAPS